MYKRNVWSKVSALLFLLLVVTGCNGEDVEVKEDNTVEIE